MTSYNYMQIAFAISNMPLDGDEYERQYIASYFAGTFADDDEFNSDQFLKAALDKDANN